jgi:DNA-binding response OmpR family regulator
MKLLYAEDEKALSMAVAEILKMEGFDVDAVYSGDEAYNSICNGTYDGIILVYLT